MVRAINKLNPAIIYHGSTGGQQIRSIEKYNGIQKNTRVVNKNASTHSNFLLLFTIVFLE